MVTLLLAIIYMAFISLGLPDILLGAAWPVMVEELNVPLSYGGLLFMIISCGTILSSLFSDKLTRRMGAGLVTAISVLLTALALLGFSLSRNYTQLCLLAIPFGLGAGAIDAALNNYVALHFAGRHMNWLHACWGVGASIGPYVMSYALGAGIGWRSGYGIVSALQFGLTLALFLSLPLWKKRAATTHMDAEDYEAPMGLRDAVKIRGVKSVLLAMFGYCMVETTAGLWTSTYLVEYRHIDTDTAAAFASLFYIGITVGRIVSGFLSDRLGDKRMIRIGCSMILTGLVLIGLPLTIPHAALGGLIILGLGCAPVYPAVIHATPANFGRENSHAIVGIQMASAYTGATVMPPVFGLIAEHLHVGLFPLYMAVGALLVILLTERVNRVCK